MNLTDEDFKHKIVNASPTRLIIVSYEIILDRIDKAASVIDSDNDALLAHIDSAKAFVTELVASLNMEQPIAKDMADIYFFTNRLLTTAYFKRDKQSLSRAREIIDKLRVGLSKEVKDGDGKGEGVSVSDTYRK